MKKLRLLLFSTCNRSCAGCCNKDWNLDTLPICTDFHNWDEVILTGGEPMLKPGLVIETAKKFTHFGPVLVYTAKIDNIFNVARVLFVVSGMTVTLHEQKDVDPLIKLLDMMPALGRIRSMRLNVFSGITVPEHIGLEGWKIKRDIEWIKDCPLPTDEVFMRLAPSLKA